MDIGIGPLISELIRLVPIFRLLERPRQPNGFAVFFSLPTELLFTIEGKKKYMHGIEETTNLPRAVWTMVHLCMVGIVGWVYFDQGIETIGHYFQQNWQSGNLMRKYLLFGCGVILWFRMTATAFIFLKRKFAWDECFPVIGASGMYQLGFAFLGTMTAIPIGLIDYFALGLFVLGSGLNTGSEWQRNKFKKNPQNNGKLYTQGLFAMVRHPNYLGDILWATGWAILTRNSWAIAIPVICAAGFVFMSIPQLSNYLTARYGEQYEEWEKRTKKLFPMIY